MYVGVWEGEYRGHPRRWVRWWTRDGVLVPTPYEAQRARAEQTQQELEAERQRAEQALRELEAERLRAEQLVQRLRELGIDPETM